MSTFQPVPSYAEVSYSYYDEKSKTTKSKFNPVWLSWFISLHGFATSGVVTGSDLVPNQLVIGVDVNVVSPLGDYGAVGDALTSQGAGLPPVWAAAAAATVIANNRLLANISGGIAAPIGMSISTFLDAVIGNTQGAIITRQGANWVILGPGAAGTKLTSGGAGANLSWT